MNIDLDFLIKHRIVTRSGTANSHSKKYLKNDSKLYERIRHEYPWFDIDATPIAVLVHCVKNQIDDIPLCIECNKPLLLNFNSTTGFPVYCSTKCSNKSEIKKQQIVKSNDEKWNGHPRQCETVKEKQKQTYIRKYGVEHHFQLKSQVEKSKNTNREKYGSEWYHKSKRGRKRLIETNQRKYGSDFPFQSKDIQQKVRQSVKNVHGVKSTAQLDHVKLKKAETCKERYGFETAHYTGLISKRDFEDKLKNKDWLIEQHHIKERTLKEIAIELGFKDEQTIARKCKQFDIEIRRFFSSRGEREVREFIQSVSDYKIEANIRNVIPPYELDIFLPELSIAIEYCGLYWHCEINRPDRNYHKRKWELCRKKGIRLITLFEDEWDCNNELIKQKLMNILNIDTSTKVYARHTHVIDNVPIQDQRTFFNTHHIQGFVNNTYCVGLKRADTYIAMISLVKQKESLVLNRFATSVRCPGGFSKLLKYVVNNYKKNIITFADLRWSLGDLYENSGFTLTKTLPPDYEYIVQGQRVHKFNFRHKFLKTKLEHYDPTLSEHQNMLNHNVFRIYNCGLYRFELDVD